MTDLRLDGTSVSTSTLTQRAYQASACELLLNVTAANKTEALSTLREAGPATFSGLRVTGLEDLSFLAEFPNLLYLELSGCGDTDPARLECLFTLRGLRLESLRAGLDYSCFPWLEVYEGPWHPDSANLARARELRKLVLQRFQPRTPDLADLRDVPRLECLELAQSGITTLQGLATLEDLRYLALSDTPDLCSLDELESADLGLRELALDGAGSLATYAPIARLRRLRRLKLMSCAPMPSLEWIRGLDRLDLFSFVDTDVVDGDLTPLLALPRLEYVSMLNRPDYNLRRDELRQRLAQRRS